ncbi:P-loop containing nucleoside triphosphate hydrolase protein [Massarina eburnea CBS 473.64]|uniref:P-loop containing nucleoside triphosphate hydrolase protein n=1 Tax=Massarina eburnea CBS 473.64 TaxID=1395130 RepID=A0A6A6SFY1_9PLEO|nr:P-loop containing nucleoside triphosphate hydrolase protein [Massarina eburnea CBS 473.64]
MSFSTGNEDLLHLNQAQFDFSIPFEQLFFSIVPSALFIVAAIWRTLSQLRKPTVVKALAFRLIKLSVTTTFAALELALLILVTIESFPVASMFIAATVLKFVSSLILITLSMVEHGRNLKPSVLLNVYLSLTLLLDAAQVRSLFLSSATKSETTYSAIFCATLALKAIILLLEAKQKTAWVRWDKKEHSPEETSGIFSLSVFFWLNKLFRLGYKKVLMIEDLYPLDSAMNTTLLHGKFAKEMDYSKLRGDKYGLAKVLFRTLKVHILLPIAPRLAMLGFTFCQPFFMQRLIEWLAQAEHDANSGYGFIGATVLIYSGIAISMSLYWYFHNRARTMARGILVKEIYRKATQARIDATSDGAALTLMSTDIERITIGFRSLHENWACVLQAALAAWMLYHQLGVVFLASIGLVIVCFFCLTILIHFTGDSQKAWMTAVQNRVGLTATVIASMKNLKISGLSGTVGTFVQKLRVDELAVGARFRLIFITAAMLGFVPWLIGPPLTFALTQKALDASTMFTSLAFLALLTSPFSDFFGSIPEIFSALACLHRVQLFLECETRRDFRQVLAERRWSEEKGAEDASHMSRSEVVIKNASFGWEADKFVLRDVNTRIPKSSLTVVVGAVASGKSTFCHALLGEIPFSEGSVVSNTDFAHVGYCDQSVALSNGSLRDNIVGFSPFNEERYTEVMNATTLKIDLSALPQGDATNIGSDGITLSGGQKQRVALARALYLGSDFLVLDDIFSGLDADTEDKVFQQIFAPGGLLRRRRTTVVLCTHSVKHLSSADHIIVLGKGTIVEQGNFVDLMMSKGYVQGLGLTRASSDAPSEQSTSKESVEGAHETQLQTTTTNVASDLLDGDQARKVGDKTVYKHYIMSMGVFVAALSVFLSALWGFFQNFPTIWLAYWTNDVYSPHPNHSYAYYAGIYALLQICALLSGGGVAIAIWIVALNRAGATIHYDALQTLIRAPLRFFTKTDTGVVINLFSQDLNLIDTELPQATLSVLWSLAQALGQAAIMMTSSAWLGIAYPFLGVVLYFVGRFYLRTSRQLRLLDLEAKSPLYTHFLDTVKGIATLRAFGFLSDDLKKNARLVDTSQRPAYLLLMIQEWLNLVLGLVVMVIAVILVTLSVQLHSKSAFAGASLYSLISLGENLAGIVKFYTRLETSIGAVSRLRTFSETVVPEDRDDEDAVPSESWPTNGVIEIKGISATYAPNDQPNTPPNLALRNIHLTIHSGENIALCGRTGSGKSSLLSLLLKLLDPTPSTAENILIDTIPLHRINRHMLRQRIIAIPQDSVFLPDATSFQTNLDPSGSSTPQECDDVLTAVGLSSFVHERGGLTAGMYVGMMSAGQRQLMAVSRAVLRRRIRARGRDGGAGVGVEGGILLLDEVGSNVDYETERVIWDVVRTEFRGYTVLAVSHRLDMVMDFDRVVVMDLGEVVEVGGPRELVGRVGSWFGGLVGVARGGGGEGRGW